MNWTEARRGDREISDKIESQRTCVGWWMQCVFHIIFNMYLLHVYGLLDPPNRLLLSWDVPSGK